MEGEKKRKIRGGRRMKENRSKRERVKELMCSDAFIVTQFNSFERYICSSRLGVTKKEETYKTFSHVLYYSHFVVLTE